MLILNVAIIHNFPFSIQDDITIFENLPLRSIQEYLAAVRAGNEHILLMSAGLVMKPEKSI